MDMNNDTAAAADAEAMDASNHQPPRHVGAMDDNVSNDAESTQASTPAPAAAVDVAANNDATTSMVANAAMAANAGTTIEALNRHNGTFGVSATNDASERPFATQLWCHRYLQHSLNTTMVTNATTAMVTNATMAANAGTLIDDGVTATNDTSESPFAIAPSIIAFSNGSSQHSV